MKFCAIYTRAALTFNFFEAINTIPVPQVRKLWGEYSEAWGAESREAGGAASSDTAGSSGINLDLVAAGQGPGRALRAFVDAVDLGDAKQAGVLQNLVSFVRSTD